MSISNLFIENDYNLFSNSLHVNDLTIDVDLHLPGELVVDQMVIYGTSNSTSQSTGSLVVAGGVGIGQNLNVGGNLNVVGNINGNLFLPTIGGTQTVLNYYEMSTFSYAVSGAITGVNLTGKFIRQNTEVTINFDGISASNSASSIITVPSASIPTRFRPVISSVYGCITVLDNSIVNLGTVFIGIDGSMSFFVGSNSNFTALGNSGIKRIN